MTETYSPGVFKFIYFRNFQKLYRNVKPDREVMRNTYERIEEGNLSIGKTKQVCYLLVCDGGSIFF